ncbi:hypothetical protein BOX15_Mlig029455g2, partial [Macrostomum lignano]
DYTTVGMNNCGSDSDDNDDDYVELANDGDTDMSIGQSRLQCLFCRNQASVDLDDLINKHLPAAHGIANFASLLVSIGVQDQPTWVQFVAFVRSKNFNATTTEDGRLQQLLDEFRVTAGAVQDGSGDNTIPSAPVGDIDDPLMYEVDIEELLQSQGLHATADLRAAGKSNSNSQAIDKDQRIVELELQVESLKTQIVSMSTVLRRFALGGNSDDVIPAASSRTIAELKDDEDGYYVDSYSGASIHAEMLQDRIRTGGYHDFIAGNPLLFNERVVMDVGCGTGILSMFAARAGAAKVLAVDCAEVIARAKEAAAENGLENRISFYRGKLEQLDELKVGVKVDAIVSEWMGYCLLYEGMLESVLYARDHCLKPGGAVYPRICNLLLCGIDSEELYQRNALYFDNVYGVRVSFLKERCLSEPHVAYDLQSDWVATSSALVCSIDMLTASAYTSAKVESVPVQLTALRDCKLHAIVGYFDVDFLGNGDAGVNVSFSTGPLSQVTHWGQTVFYLRSPISLSSGQVLEFHVSILPPHDSPRSLLVEFDWSNGTRSEFRMD